MEKLKPCPFCGGEATIQGSEKGKCCWAMCGGCLSARGGNCATEEEAVEAWNKRYPTPKRKGNYEEKTL